MSDATNWNVFEKMIQESVRSALIELGELVNEKVKKNIERTVYDYGDRNREVYEPTGEFGKSFKSSDITLSPNNPEVLIKSDPSELHTYQPEKYVHGSIYAGGTIEEDVREYLAEILAFNTSGDLFGQSEWWHDRDSYFYDTLEELKSGGWLGNTFKKLLRKRGLSVK